eukprot:6195068-Pleurochrysis_carterae.AAC.1
MKYNTLIYREHTQDDAENFVVCKMHNVVRNLQLSFVARRQNCITHSRTTLYREYSGLIDALNNLQLGRRVLLLLRLLLLHKLCPLERLRENGNLVAVGLEIEGQLLRPTQHEKSVKQEHGNRADSCKHPK